MREEYKTLMDEDQKQKEAKQELKQQKLLEQHKADLEHFHKLYMKQHKKNETEDNFYKRIEDTFEELVENMRTHEKNRDQQI